MFITFWSCVIIIRFCKPDCRVVVAVENVNTHKPEWFPEPVPNETVEIEEELEETDFVVLKVNARDQDVGSDNSRIGSVFRHSVDI